MRQTLIIALSLFLGCATGAAVRDIVVPARAQGSTGPLYEYFTAGSGDEVIKPKDAQPILARAAREGWRYVGGLQHGGTTVGLIFERTRGPATPAAPQGQQ